jgi:hypothetical protein
VNPKELYNLRHATLRSRAIECAFGYLKNKFQIFHSPLSFKSIEAQSMVILCCIGLHNFIKNEEGIEEHLLPDLGDDDAHLGFPISASMTGRAHRNSIASQMWHQYQQYLLNQE